jgi:hypothetical protein
LKPFNIEEDLLFVECRQFQNFPRFGWGVLAAVKLKNKEDFKFCVVYWLDTYGNTLHYYQSKGNLFYKDEALKSNFLNHFQAAKTHDESISDIVYLNQVHGERALGIPLQVDVVNKKDNKFDCSIKGPDTIFGDKRDTITMDSIPRPSW